MMSNIIEYKGYHTRVEYDSDDNCLSGQVIGIKDLIVFCGESIDEFVEAFHESVDAYLDMCERNGKKPNTEFSGRFNVRISPDAHRKMAMIADKKAISLNEAMTQAVSNHISSNGGA
jgi:predicted HicB family RNase H-like nuclease